MRGMRRACMFTTTCVHAFTSWLYGFLQVSTQTKPGLVQNPPLQEMQEVSVCQSLMRRSAELKLLTLTQSLAIR